MPMLMPTPMPMPRCQCQRSYCHTKQYKTIYRNIKCDLLNFRGVQKGYHQDFQYLIVFIDFIHEVATHKKIFFHVFDGETLLYP